jgi:DNA sulfur modification protein DndD
VRINRITFENFMPYYGTNVLDLRAPINTPVILILGENGYGKTSIHHAIRWCLYGKTKPLKSDEIIPPYKLLNWKSRAEYEAFEERNPKYRETSFSVQIEFEHLGQEFELKRKHLFVGTDLKGSEDVSLRIGNGNYVSGGKIKELVEGVLSEDLSQFFLFDGEVLDRFEEMRTQDQQAKFVKQQIESTLGIPKLKHATSWVEEKVQEQLKLLKKNESQSKKESELRNSIAQDEDLKKGKEVERIDLIASLNQANSELEKLKLILGNYEAIKKDLDRERDLRADLKNDEKSFIECVNILSSYHKQFFWAPLAVKLLSIQNTQIEMKPEVLRLEAEREALNARVSLYSELASTGRCPVCESESTIQTDTSKLKELQETLNAVIVQLDSYKGNFISNFESLVSTLELSEINYSSVRDQHKKLGKIKESIARKKLELNSLLERVPVSSNDLDQRENLVAYERLTRQVAQDQIFIHAVENEIENLKQKLSTNRSQLARIQTNTSKPARSFAFYSNLAAVMEQTIEIYAQKVRAQVEFEASKVFKQIISEKDFEALQINPMFGMEIKRKDGNLVLLRSEGQAHIAAISLVAGLLKTAIKDGFILMDTPFGRLDMTHRENICSWIVDSGLQVALFVHSGEFQITDHSHLLANKVGRTYEIRRLDINHSEFLEVG